MFSLPWLIEPSLLRTAPPLGGLPLTREAPPHHTHGGGMRKITGIIIHCSDSPFGDRAQINDWHKQRGWNGIGYHYVILNGVIKSGDKYDPAKDGVLQDGRPLEKVGAHCQGHNAESIGICLIGKKTFSEKQLQRLLWVVGLYMDRFKISIDHVKGHYEYDKGKTCPNFDMNIFRHKLRISRGDKTHV